jgi:anaerobic magnesium-protoporphyrin IX monomethyl ester cyclase
LFRHVLCVYPYRVEMGRRDHIYPPLGIEVIAARLKGHCRDIDVIDLRRESKCTKDFLRPDTDLVCFSVNWDLEREAVRSEILSVPREVRTVVGGQYASMEAEQWLSECPNIDALVRGDGEDTVLDLAAIWAEARAEAKPGPAENRPFEGVAGVSYRLNGRVIHNEGRSPGPIADDFRPDRSLRRYTYAIEWPGIRTGLTFDTVASSTGCPYNCKFCSFNRDPWGERRSWRARSPESVVEELAEIDAKLVGFVDLEFTHDLDRVARICDLVLERGIRKRYIANARIEMAKRPDVVAKMQRAGFSALLLGIESAQDKTLRDMRKGFTTAKAREYFRVLRRSTMILHGTFVTGYFGETEAEMRSCVRYARELGLDTVNFCQFRVQRNSNLREFVAEHSDYHVAPSGEIYSDQCSLEQLTRLRGLMFRSFYGPGQLFKAVRKGVKNGLVTPRVLGQMAKFLVRAAAGRFNPDSMRPFVPTDE